MSTEHVITRVGEEDLDELLPLLRGYCDFYEVSPSDEALLAVSRALIADPEHEGAAADRARRRTARRSASRRSTGPGDAQRRRGSRVMNDLFVAPEARGSGLADRLIAACRERAAEHGAGELEWQTPRTTTARRRSTTASAGAARSGSTTPWPCRGTRLAP